MPIENIEVPSVAESVTEVTLLSWAVKVGQFVEADDPICEVETDKANTDLPSPHAGVITSLDAEVGDTIEVGNAIAKIDTDKTEADAGNNGGEAETKSEAASGSNGTTATVSKAVAEAGAPDAVDHDALADLSPAVRRIVSEKGLTASDIPASGPGGRLTKQDVLSYVDQQAAPAKSESAKPAVPETKKASPPAAPRAVATVGAGDQTTRRMPMSKMRKKIAENLLAAQQNAAILTTFNEVDLTEVMALRKKYKEPFGEKHGVGLGFMSFFGKAAAIALGEYERVNARIEGDDIVYHDYVNLGIAVSTERGLAVPVVKDVQSLSFAQVESEIKRVAIAARDGKLGLKDMSGGTFTITNGGVFGSLLSTPILNPPQSGILGMHTIQQRPMAVDGEVKIRPMMYLALSYDHRIVDGKESVSFLVRLKQLLEDPARLLLDV
ncbi:MAG: 2-oxoglutarate dehydrogenase complex dihydrolipoyllysine-residue succinyltransferase [Planctomycetota bacterium]